MKTSELTGEPLNWATAKALRHRPCVIDCGPVLQWWKHKYRASANGYRAYDPSTEPNGYALGLIERHIMRVRDFMGRWDAIGLDGQVSKGDTLMEAVQRAIVHTNLGDEVDVPKELMP